MLRTGKKYNTEGRKLHEFCERNNFEILDGEYGADMKCDYSYRC
jgi:hypothetical protein